LDVLPVMKNSARFDPNGRIQAQGSFKHLVS